MSGPSAVRVAGERVEEILEELAARAGESTMAQVEELVRVLLDLYGSALGRIVDLMADADALRRVAADPLVCALLVLHDLHPDPPAVRIEKALAGIRPHLGAHAGDVRFVGIDGGGVVHLRLEGTCHHCPSSSLTVRGAVEQAVLAAAPEAVSVDVEGLVEPGSQAFVPVESVGLKCPTGLAAEAVR